MSKRTRLLRWLGFPGPSEAAMLRNRLIELAVENQMLREVERHQRDQLERRCAMCKACTETRQS